MIATKTSNVQYSLNELNDFFSVLAEMAKVRSNKKKCRDSQCLVWFRISIVTCATAAVGAGVVGRLSA